MRAGPSQEEIRRHNLGALLRHVHLSGPTSRAELTEFMRKESAQWGQIVRDRKISGG